MAADLGNTRTMGPSDCSLKCKFKRKRRRSKRKDRASVLSSLIGPMKLRDTGTTSMEDGDTSSTSSVDVKENRVSRYHVDFPTTLPGQHRPPFLYTDISRGGTRTLKRKQPLVEGQDRLLYQLQLICKRTSWAVNQKKNALVHLNELRPGLQYETLSQTGPVHAPVFCVGVELDGLRFEGRGPTKKKAKMRAAELALRSFIQFPNASQAHVAMGNLLNVNAAADFTSDQADDPDDTLFKEFDPPVQVRDRDLPHPRAGGWELLSSRPAVYNHGTLVRLMLDLMSSDNPRKHRVGSSIVGQCPMGLLSELSPVGLLSELREGLRYVCLMERVHGRPVKSFVMAVRVDGRIFEGCGRSKRLAKAQAATAALQAIFNINLGLERTMGLTNSWTKSSQLPQCFAESIFHLVREKYEELTESCCSTSLHTRHKVLAGIVMTRGFDLRRAQVVALGTGTRCVGGESAGDRGLSVSDCHAEVITRRAFLRFLYSHLELVLSKRPDSSEQSILVPDQGCGYRLKDGVLFHMYVSSSPCGDARLNCPYEVTATHRSSHRLVRKFRCHLRMKVGGGEGTLPVNVRTANQRWDRSLPWEPPVTMSCTDKLARWNVLGLQGSLLSLLVEPVYLRSLTVGTLCHTGHLGRTLARRLGPVAHLPPSYRRNQLLLGCLGGSEAHQAGTSPSVSLNWTSGDGQLEVVSASTGRRKDSGTPSRLCKHSLFTRWERLQNQVSGAERAQTMQTYSGAKMAVGGYQRARQQFVLSLQEAGLGTWARKPPGHQHFHGSV